MSQYEKQTADISGSKHSSLATKESTKCWKSSSFHGLFLLTSLEIERDIEIFKRRMEIVDLNHSTNRFAIDAALSVNSLSYFTVYKYIDPDFPYFSSWFPSFLMDKLESHGVVPPFHAVYRTHQAKTSQCLFISSFGLHMPPCGLYPVFCICCPQSLCCGNIRTNGTETT